MTAGDALGHVFLQRLRGELSGSRWRTSGSGGRRITSPQGAGTAPEVVPPFLSRVWVEQAGTYRVIADFVPSETGEGVTLSTSVQVAGNYAPEPATSPVTTTTVDGLTSAWKVPCSPGNPRN